MTVFLSCSKTDVLSITNIDIFAGTIISFICLII